ncbi:ATP-binding domain-containing protein [Nostoc sp. WHI]|uniref:ATP-binding domain-containing protein n=1 Tax=Nostoc sp. WHI TaxID=2650611 RepID=UPI0018C6B39B|nr:ATP-binding domain-containing protein [Nostoc sp. WHI]MBG1271514.1 DNA/RNA helicase [Nostoc sp. WHI]
MVTATNNQVVTWKFIETESTGGAGYQGERIVWDTLRQNLTQGEGIAIWGYRAFSQEERSRREMDILLVSKDLGLAIIEVKSIGISDIKNVEANRWKMIPSFYKEYLAPIEQAEKQAFAIINRCDENFLLNNKVAARVIVALPKITRRAWRGKGFDDNHLACPPIIFKDDLERQPDLLDYIANNATVIRHTASTLNDQQWQQLLKKVVSPIPDKTPPVIQNTTPSPRSQAIAHLHEWISDVDWQQTEIGMQIPPGPQRIRGTAGSGKTLLLCQKAARMHLRHSDWDIALVFFTRSLYNLIIELVDQWLRYFSGGEVCYNAKSSKLKILHAWGGTNQPGLYSTICKASRVQPKNVSHFPNFTPETALAAACRDLLEVATIAPQFDAILIDEGQDLIIDDDALKFQGKQPFYWMAYQALRSPEANTPELRRLIWAYDEAQSLNSLVIPTSKQVLGSELSQIIGGSSGGFYLGKIRKAHVLKRSYRTPRCILAAAQALGMGLLRPEGMLAGITNKKDWERIGYQVTQGDFRIPGATVTLTRPQENSPNPIQTLWDKELISFQSYSSRQAELKALANCIKHNIEDEKLNPSQDILVIVLGNSFETKRLQEQTANHLLDVGINYYIPTAPTINCFPNNSQNVFPNRFWNPDSVTIAGIHRAKGNEASVVYVVGLDYIARNESNITARNQLFTAMTRTRGWLYLSGIGNYPMYNEIRQVIQSDSTFTFTFQRPKRDVSE